MTIRFTDECPNCEKNLKNFVVELDEEFYEPFSCPYCEAMLEFNKNKYKVIATFGFLLMITLSLSVWCISDSISNHFGYSLGCPNEWNEVPWNYSKLIMMIIFGLIWLQDLKMIKSPEENK